MENFGEANSLLLYETKKAHLINAFHENNSAKIKVEKKTASNLFRYSPLTVDKTKKISIKDFENIISIDTAQGILDVEGLTPYEKIVRFTLSKGFLPTVAPELKHITVAGAIVGIGIESTGYKYGFVHDGLIEAEVLLPSGEVIVCNANNNADLFYALPNSYGTLGYILRAKIKVYPAQPYVKIHSVLYNDIDDLIPAMAKATENSSVNFIEALVFSENKSYLMNAAFTSQPEHLDDIYHQSIFYELIQQKSTIYLSAEDYIFRYDPDWFWNIPNTFLYKLFRKFAPRSLRNSGFYKKYIDTKKRWLQLFKMNTSLNKKEEPLIQDWEVPWEKGSALLHFALKNIDLGNKPWAIIPILSLEPRTLYPLQPKSLYFNLGCYCYSKTTQHNSSFHNTKIMDEYCYSLGGLKMLYSSTFLSKEKFNALYNGPAYLALKNKYDPENKLADLYQKVCYRKNVNL